MNIFNRLAVILLFLLLALAAIVIAILPEQFIRAGQATFEAMPTTVTPVDRIYVILAAAAITLVAVLIINAEIQPKRTRAVTLPQAKGGMAELSTDSIAVRIKHTVESLADVRQVNPSITSHGKSIDVHLHMVANPGVDISAKASEVMQVVRQLVENDIGIKLGKVRVNIKYDASAAKQVAKA